MKIPESVRINGVEFTVVKEHRLNDGERAERCQWQEKRDERVAAVGRERARFAGRSYRREPQQES